MTVAVRLARNAVALVLVAWALSMVVGAPLDFLRALAFYGLCFVALMVSTVVGDDAP